MKTKRRIGYIVLIVGMLIVLAVLVLYNWNLFAHPHRDELTPEKITERLSADETAAVVVDRTVYEDIPSVRLCELLLTEQWQPCGENKSAEESGVYIAFSSEDGAHIYADGTVCVTYLGDRVWYKAPSNVVDAVKQYVTESL